MNIIKITPPFFLSLFFLLFSSKSFSIDFNVPADVLPEGGFSAIEWVDRNISNWPRTTTLEPITTTGFSANAFINLDYSSANRWPIGTGPYIRNGDPVVANAWVIVKHGGKWIAGTWEYMRPGQTQKFIHAVGGGAISALPNSWSPKKGDELYFFMSGLVRLGLDGSNVSERSNIVRYFWGDVDPNPEPTLIHTYRGRTEGQLSANLGGSATSFPLEDEITVVVNNNGSLSFNIRDSEAITNVVIGETFTANLNYPLTDTCNPKMKIKGKIESNFLSGTLLGTDNCGTNSAITINQTFYARSLTEPIFKDLKPGFVFNPAPLLLLLLEE